MSISDYKDEENPKTGIEKCIEIENHIILPLRKLLC